MNAVDWRNAGEMTSCRWIRRQIITAPSQKYVGFVMLGSWVTWWRNTTRKPDITRLKQHQVNFLQLWNKQFFHIDYFFLHYQQGINNLIDRGFSLSDAKKFTRILENITPKDILPYSWNYYTYSGSLTAPPCYESVQWIVMRCPIKISRKVNEIIKWQEI